MNQVYWIFAVVYTFMKWGFWWGMLSIVLPIFPMIDLCKHIIETYL
jgi:hypothetical protein